MSTSRATLLIGLMLSSSAAAAISPVSPNAPKAAKSEAPKPKWEAKNEPFENWPDITFNDGKTTRRLNCRRAECDPAKNKGLADLYELKELATTTTKSKIYTPQEKSPLNPSRLLGDTYDKVDGKEITAPLKTYNAKLSGYKLDLSVTPPQVVLGEKRFKTMSNIGGASVSIEGTQILVNPPKTAKPPLAAKPGAPAKPGRKPGRKPSTPGSIAAPTPIPPISPVAPVTPEAELGADLEVMRWLTVKEALAYRDVFKQRGGPANSDAAYAFALNNALKNTRADTAAAIRRHLKDTAANAKLLHDTEMWGGKDLTAVVPDGATAEEIKANPKLLEVSLSAEDLDALKAKNAAAKYLKDRIPHKGTASSKPHPIDLRYTLAAALEKLGRPIPGGMAGLASAPVVVPSQAGGDALSSKNLTEAERALLKPDELAAYERILKLANGNADDPNLQAANKQYRSLIEKEGRKKPYREPKTLADYNAMESWHKEIFCSKPSGATTAPATPAKSSDKVALHDLKNCDESVGESCGNYSDGRGNGAVVNATAPGTEGAPSWAKDACAPVNTILASANGDSAGGRSATGNQTTTVPPIGSPSGKPDPTPSPWLAGANVMQGIKGGMLGFVIGSLGGPVGMVIGAGVGAAFFYGLAIFMSKD